MKKTSIKFKPNEVEKYYSSIPEELRIILGKMRTTIKSVVPDAEEVISYRMPSFKQNGILVYFAAFKNHIGFYPTSSGIEAFKNELTDYKWSKGAIQFPIDKPLPVMLIKRIVKFRAQEDRGKAKTKEIKRNKKLSTKNYIKHHNDGTIWAKGQTLNDIPEGYWEWFRKDGTLMRSGFFSKGKQVGVWTTYDNNGKVYKTTEMKNK